jgi:hypothetical protein
MHKNATKCNKTQSKWCINKHGESKIIDTFETYQTAANTRNCGKRTKPLQTQETSLNEQNCKNARNIEYDQVYENKKRLEPKSDIAAQTSDKQCDSHAKDIYSRRTRLQYKVSRILYTTVNRL